MRAPDARWLPIAATAAFFVVGLIGILHHEMWRDEIEIWMLATDSSSLGELMTNIQTQPHPPLWYLMTWVVARFTTDPRAIQVLSLLIGTATAYLFARNAPFPPLVRILFCFGYFPLYEYTIISRSYGLDLLFAVAFCSLYAREEPRRYPWLAAILALMANVHLLGTVIAGLLLLLLLWDAVALARRRSAGARVWASLTAAALGILWGLSEALLAAGRMGAEHVRHSIDPRWLEEAVTSIYYAYLPIPDIFERSFWNSNVIALLPANLGQPLALGLALLLFVLSAAALRRSRLILALYGLGVVAMVAAFTEKSSAYLRHQGHLAILFVALLWLAARSLPISRMAVRALTLVLALHVAVAAFAYAVDFAHPFSHSYDGARFLAERAPAEAVLVGSVDYTAQPYAAYLRKPIYYPDQKRFGTFMTWGPERRVVRYKQVLNEAGRLERETGKPVVLILDYNPRLGGPGGRCRVDDELELELLASFQCAIVHEESYWLGILRRGTVPEDPMSSAPAAAERRKPCVSPRAPSVGPEVEIPVDETGVGGNQRHHRVERQRRVSRRRQESTELTGSWALHRGQGFELAACPAALGPPPPPARRPPRARRETPAGESSTAPRTDSRTTP